MGNCQAIDGATLVIQHPCGRVDKLYWPVTASEIMRMNPGHHVALLITTTVFHPNNGNNKNNNNTSNSNSKSSSSNDNKNGNSNTVRVTRVKLLRPTDTLALGHAYRLISTQEAMKGMVAKKQAKMRKHGLKLEGQEVAVKDAERFSITSQKLDRDNQVYNILSFHRYVLSKISQRLPLLYDKEKQSQVLCLQGLPKKYKGQQELLEWHSWSSILALIGDQNWAKFS
ncbi:hypothetical protein Dimus_004791 [Dionaea muscipula]